MIKIENLTKKYSKQTVLDILSLEIPSGQTFGLIGNNGAGKTTLFSCLLDLIKPTKGKVINNDVEVSSSENLAKNTFQSLKIQCLFILKDLWRQQCITY